MSNILKFSVSTINFADNEEKASAMNRALFRRLKIRAFASGENSHTLPIDEDVLRRGAKTIYNKPLLWKYDKFMDDSMGHEKDEVPCGFVPESIDNPIRLVRENGKLFIEIEALIWVKYCGRLIEIYERDDNHKDVSVEICYVEDESVFGEKPKILEFIIAGITLLGDFYPPACKGCESELLAFSEDKKAFLKTAKFAETTITIDNSKEAAISGKWTNPRRKLFNPCAEAANSKSLLTEAYLITDFSTEEPEITRFKYPHHLVRGDKLVLQVDGVIAAFQRASQQGIVSGKVKAHLLRHYRELGLSTENFTEFGLNKEEFELYFAEDVVKFEKECAGENMATEKFEIEGREAWGDVIAKVQDKEGKGAYVDSIEKDHIIYTLDDVRYRVDADVKVAPDDKKVSAEIKWDTKKKDSQQKNFAEGPDKVAKKDGKLIEGNVAGLCDDPNQNMSDDDDDDDKGVGDAEKKIDPDDDESDNDEIMSKMSALEAKMGELEELNGIYLSKLEKMADYDDLVKFKCDMEEKMEKERVMSEMEAVMSEVENRGIEMSKDDKTELMAKFSDFSSVEAWGNFVKAQAFERAETIDGVTRIGLPFGNKKTGSSFWDSL